MRNNPVFRLALVSLFRRQSRPYRGQGEGSHRKNGYLPTPLCQLRQLRQLRPLRPLCPLCHSCQLYSYPSTRREDNVDSV
jgi:hypothetical protein